MSNSTALTIRKAQGRCVVCGKDTSTKCGSCSAAGIDWMYFCSPEHQKEVWPVHKRVCGSNPFLWPLLSEKEVNGMISLLHVPAKSVNGPTTWAEQLKVELGPAFRRSLQGKSEEEEKEIILKRFKDGIVNQDFVEAQTKSHAGTNQRKQQRGLVDLRAMAFSVKACSKDPLTGNITTGQRHQLLAEDPFGFLSWMEHKTIKYMAYSYSAPWWSTFQHRVLLYVSSLAVEHEKNLWNLSAKTWVVSQSCQHALKEAAYLSEEIISKTHLTEANAITSRLLEGIREEIGTKQDCQCSRDCGTCGHVKPLFESSPY